MLSEDSVAHDIDIINTNITKAVIAKNSYAYLYWTEFAVKYFEYCVQSYKDSAAQIREEIDDVELNKIRLYRR